MTGRGHRCRVCRKEPTIIQLESYRLNLCLGCFDDFVLRRVKKAIKGYKMIGHSQRILVAVSGGKDSLALWDILIRLGYKADGYYIDLGIGEYSAESKRLVQAFADERKLTLHISSVAEDFHGYGIDPIARKTRRKSCAVCGTVKRHYMNRFTIDHDYDVLATGHNLDDEVTVLFGNVLHWQTDYLGRQYPVLPAVEEGLSSKVKPLVYLGEKEMAAYCMTRGIPYIYEECPMAVGAKSIFYKEILNQLEQRSPGTKLEFFKGFLSDKGRFDTEKEKVDLAACETCGTLTTAGLCATCRLKERLRPEPAPEPEAGSTEAIGAEPEPGTADEPGVPDEAKGADET